MPKIDRVKRELTRLNRIFADLPPNELQAVEGLIEQAARLRIMQDEVWQDIKDNGRTELFAQSPEAEPYERERPAVKQFQAAVKNYQAAIKQLLELVPPSQQENKLAELMRDDE